MFELFPVSARIIFAKLIVGKYFADVAELVDALDLGSSVFGREGSSPFIRIKKIQAIACIFDFYRIS